MWSMLTTTVYLQVKDGRLSVENLRRRRMHPYPEGKEMWEDLESPIDFLHSFDPHLTQPNSKDLVASSP